MSALVVDALKFGKQLRQAGVPDNQAETFIEALSAFAAEREEQATKRDLREMEGRQEVKLAEIKRDLREMEDRQEAKLAEIKRDMKEIESRQEIRMAELQRDMREIEANLKRDMKEMEDRLTRDMKAIETSLKRDIAELDVRLRHELDLVRLEMRDLERRMTIKLGSLMVVAVSVVAVLVKLL